MTLPSRRRRWLNEGSAFRDRAGAPSEPTLDAPLPPFPVGPLIPARLTPVAAAPGTPPVPLSTRMQQLALRHCSREVLGCPFEGGGKLFGVGIASALYCRLCGNARDWHDVAQAAVRLAVLEASERLF